MLCLASGLSSQSAADGTRAGPQTSADAHKGKALHSSQVWYCVSPSDRRRFEDMAKQLFPEMARSCRAFLRHKDVLMSPRVLRSYNIQVTQV